MEVTRSDDRAPRLRRRTDMARVRAMQLPPEMIARRAYEIFVERGGQDGRDMDDWLRAERELAVKTARTNGL